MRAVMVMFDSLNRQMLPPYGCDWTVAPNFQRLAERTVTFDNCYAGSMPCMPARREMHTGRHNFLHRSWGPLEPFDDSVFEMLKKNGVYTHLVTDHQHYWEDGGATYHNRYNTYEFFRGQEGDAWKGVVGEVEIPADLKTMKFPMWRQDWVNREYLPTVETHPQTLTFDAGLHFIQTNINEDNWFVQIETFDPHEPFFSYEEHKKHYPHDYDGPHFDWPDYAKVTHDDATVQHVRYEYGSLLTFCDNSLGRVLDYFDLHDMWKDTLLIVCTDHGFMLGEHGWYGKSSQPWFDQTIHTPLFIWDPRLAIAGERRESLVQTIDIGPTLLEFFNVGRTPDMMGQPLVETARTDAPIREAGLFGNHGSHISVTDGRWVYMRAPGDVSNQPLFEHTLMPTSMRDRFPVQQLAAAEFVDGFSFTKGLKVLRMPGQPMTNAWFWGSLLFDLENDPEQAHPLIDDEQELHLATVMRDLMVANDAPDDQFARMRLPREGVLGPEHLLVREGWDRLQESLRPAPKAEEFPAGRLSIGTPLGQLMQDPIAKETVQRHLPMMGAVGGFLMRLPGLSLLNLSAMMAGALPRATIDALAADLAAIE